MNITVQQPFDLSASLESGQVFRWQRLGSWYSGVIHGNLVKIRQDDLGLEFYSWPVNEEVFVPHLSNYFRLDDKFHLILKEINKDRFMARLISRYHGLRLLRQETWECLVAFICSASSNIPRISSTMKMIASNFGQPLTFKEHTQYTFPAAEKLAEIGESSLRSLGLGFRAKYVFGAASLVAENRINLRVLRELPYEESKEMLMGLTGVGHKIADCVLLFSLDKLEAFPIDRWVQRAVEEWYFDSKKLRINDIRKWASDYFGSYAGYAQQYLFHGRRLEGL